jgi:hypothetical protein
MILFGGFLDFNPEAVVASRRANNLPPIPHTFFPQKKLYTAKISKGLRI